MLIYHKYLYRSVIVEIKGTTAFVTGGASGIGLAIGKALSMQGANVMLSDINEEGLKNVAMDFSGPVDINVLDVRDRAMWSSARKNTEDRFGPVDILINNAGIMYENAGTSYKKNNLINQTAESFDRLISVNLVGVYNGIHEFGPGMIDRKRGHIVNTSSMQGLITRAGAAAYCAAKFGVVGMTEALRQEVSHLGIGVSVLCPGPVQTSLINNTYKLLGLPEVKIPENIGIPADIVADQVVSAILNNEAYIITHGEYILPIAQRQSKILSAALKNPVTNFYNPRLPLPGTPEFSDFMADNDELN